MALRKCPECRRKISENAEFCPHCGFSFKAADLELYKQKLEQHRLHNRELNKQNARVQLVWLLIFAVVIGLAAWWRN
ncbi:zinc ribbon domain-containing protein [Bisgaard Taxon 10/6]|uniref:zinc ribbon domain-containing protein n=1 Tax=Exercitatus varius TaxID=67857 RepID=UPI00294B145D|nr:zinc ribbon domain-containing protein [Exercitatus varius]MDG2915465.1 zinc ribbon domain-containing protein [Exercitatus varius]MDG2952174.1 zinc ribbon domain-containing protein [Exercitatus varius]MDG2960836.1 zinc ribbon domain-containing protein [Exercitatus varius]